MTAADGIVQAVIVGEQSRRRTLRREIEQAREALGAVTMLLDAAIIAGENGRLEHMAELVTMARNRARGAK